MPKTLKKKVLPLTLTCNQAGYRFQIGYQKYPISTSFYTHIGAVCTCIGKTYSARILQWINNTKEWCNNHWGGAEVIIASFMSIVYPLKYPSSICLSCLDNGLFVGMQFI